MIVGDVFNCVRKVECVVIGCLNIFIQSSLSIYFVLPIQRLNFQCQPRYSGSISIQIYPLISYIWSVTKQPPLSHPSLKLINFLGWLISTDGSASRKEEVQDVGSLKPSGAKYGGGELSRHSFRQWLITCLCRIITYTNADFLPDRWCCRWRFKMKMKCQANFLVLNT